MTIKSLITLDAIDKNDRTHSPIARITGNIGHMNEVPENYRIPSNHERDSQIDQLIHSVGQSLQAVRIMQGKEQKQLADTLLLEPLPLSLEQIQRIEDHGPISMEEFLTICQTLLATPSKILEMAETHARILESKGE